MLEKTGNNYALAIGKPTKVTFMDANWQQVAALEFVTDEYGAFNGSFTAPSGVLTGQMTIKNESGSVAFRVEEYKRPTFDVTFSPVEGNYRLNDIVTVTGKAQAYAGNAIDGATVSFRVIREARFPYWDWFRWGPLPSSPQVEITPGYGKNHSRRHLHDRIQCNTRPLPLSGGEACVQLQDHSRRDRHKR